MSSKCGEFSNSSENASINLCRYLKGTDEITAGMSAWLIRIMHSLIRAYSFNRKLRIKALFG